MSIVQYQRKNFLSTERFFLICFSSIILYIPHIVFVMLLPFNKSVRYFCISYCSNFETYSMCANRVPTVLARRKVFSPQNYF